MFYSIGASDPDEDDLRYEFTCPTLSGSPLTPRIGYSCKIPIPGIKLDTITGSISFKSNTGGVFLVAIWVKEYDQCSGQLKGMTRREIEFHINTNANKMPKDISGVSNLSANATKTNPYGIRVCQGEKISWHDTIYDPDITDTLHFESNIADVLPGATWSKTFLTRNKAVLKFEWFAVIGGNPIKSFFVSYDDNRCNFPGRGYSVFEIEVLNGIFAGFDIKVCDGDTAFLNATGGSLYTWKRISGDSIKPGINWFPDTTSTDTNKNVLFLPLSPTRLEVRSNLVNLCNKHSSSCNTVDTILVTPSDSFHIKTSPDQLLM